MAANFKRGQWGVLRTAWEKMVLNNVDVLQSDAWKKFKKQGIAPSSSDVGVLDVLLTAECCSNCQGFCPLQNVIQF